MGFLGGHPSDFLKFNEDGVDFLIQFFLSLFIGGDGGIEGLGLLLKVVFLFDKGGVTWKVGDAYGFEFASIDLPNGYIFGSDYSRDLGNPVRGEDVIRFRVSENSGSGAHQGTDGKSTVSVYCLRPNASGDIEAQEVGTSESPTTRLQN